MPTTLAVFAKRPIPGQVKTRLTPALSPEAAASLYWAMVEDTWASASKLPNVDLRLFVDQPWEGFNTLAGGRPVQLQTESNLGSRMLSCLQILTSTNFNRSVIIGTDSPTLPPGHIQAAFALLQNDNDAVLGPAEDGGYYLVGCRRPHPDMFRGVAWSSDETLAQTRSAFDAQGYQTHLTPLWHDVDVIEDVWRLAKGPVGPSVKAWLRQHRL
ncbi:MAG: TIGR04282 family arsenosugar biosynthesis glycosyltransferase [Acidobacteria bacterium]|nr:TIGR04282 family arsenosugar biosynthesis glycosyltransferase [Acidobacteriota bacterium]MDA1234896.1 TIGR04282 family arsenosugar biosynthesis glycosyltransferase [Acidobacteriota bacterium]